MSKIKFVFFYQAMLWCIMAKKQSSRHMMRADNKTQTSISLRADLLERARIEAEREGRSLSNWIEQFLKQKFPDMPMEPESESESESEGDAGPGFESGSGKK